MDDFQSPDSVPLFIVMSSSLARYGIMASPPNVRISPQTRSGPTDLSFPIALILLLIVLISVVNGTPVFTLYMNNIALAAEYCRVIRVKRVGLFNASIMNRSLQSLLAEIFSLFALRLFT